MDLLFATNQPYDYLPSPGLTTNGAYFNASRVDHGLVCIDNTTYAQVTPHPESSTTTTWYHFVLYNVFNVSEDGYLIDIRAADDSLLARINLIDGKGAIQAHGDTVVTGGYTSTVISAYATHDIKVVVDASNVTVEWYINKGLVSSAVAANVGAKGKPVTMDLALADANYNSGMVSFSEIFAAETSTIDALLHMRVPAVAGFHSDYTDGVPADLGDNDDETAMLSSTNGDRMSHSVATLTIGTGIMGVAISSRAVTNGVGPSNLRHGWRIGGVDYDNASAHPVGETLGPAFDVYGVNPATGLAWLDSDINAAEVMTKSET